MITLLLGVSCLLLGWALGWIHAIYWEKTDRTALLEECVKLGIEVETLQQLLEKEKAMAPVQDS